MVILSIDLGNFKSACCLYDTANRKYRFETVATKRSHVDHLLDTHQADLIVMEACGPSGWISDVCKQRGLRAIVCSTNDEAWCWKNTKRKTDRDDALKLAKMAMLTAFPLPALPGLIGNTPSSASQSVICLCCLFGFAGILGSP